MTIRCSLSVFLLLTCGAVTAGLAQPTTTAAAPARQFTFPPVGLASTETAQINVVNLAANSSRGTAASCTGNLSFLDSSGAAIASATPFTIASGQIFSASLPYSAAGGSSSRVEIRAKVQVTLPSASNAPCGLLSSFETFDTSSGVTHLLVSGGEIGPIGPTPGGVFHR
jgi:hypothetical protein